MRERGTEGDRVGLPAWEGGRKEGGREVTRVKPGNQLVYITCSTMLARPMYTAAASSALLTSTTDIAATVKGHRVRCQQIILA